MDMNLNLLYMLLIFLFFLCKPVCLNSVECAILCSFNQFPPCGRYVWNSNTGLCMLHSNVLFERSVVSLELGDVLYSREHEGCNQSLGYTYNFETNTCIKNISTPQINWYDARALCQQDGADLISITSRSKWDFVVDYIQYRGNHWIGLHAKQWVNGEDFVNNLGVRANVNNYDGGFPDGAPCCGTLRPQSSTAPIHDESCFYRHYYSLLCEFVVN